VIKPFAPRELIARINVALIKAGKTPVAVGED
jgi:DNA-binding response OmpR family regulator